MWLEQSESQRLEALAIARRQTTRLTGGHDCVSIKPQLI